MRKYAEEYVIKLTFMGAGSTVFSKNVIGDTMLCDEFHDAEIALYDGPQLHKSGGAHYGDWLAMDSVGNICEGATQTDLITSAFFCLFHRACHSGRESAGRRYLIATTIWEHWDSLKEDGSFWSTSMNSFNHYAYGSVFDWLFGVASGIRVENDGAGYRHVSIAPHPDRRLGFVENSVETAGGVLASSWHYHGNELRYEIEIPEGTVANLTLPGQAVQRLSAGSYLFVKKR